MNSRYNVLDLLRRFNYLGEKTLKDGTLLIGKAPHIAPLAWLHTIYPSLAEEKISLLEKQIKNKIPESYKDFLRVTNGLNVFNTTLSLYGFRSSYNRTSEDVWQPFDIVLPNTLERPVNASKNIFIIGSYDWDGSYLYIDVNDNRVYLCDREDITPLYEWKNLDEMLNDEINRLICLFDKQGRELQPDKSTLPIG
jgi:hypothetical protein